MCILETTRQSYHYKRFFYQANEVLKGIQKRSFLSRPSFMCKDCKYTLVCPLWKNGKGKTHNGK